MRLFQGRVGAKNVSSHCTRTSIDLPAYERRPNLEALMTEPVCNVTHSVNALDDRKGPICHREMAGPSSAAEAGATSAAS